MPVAARSKAWFCGRPLAGIACSNPAGGMDVPYACWQVKVSASDPSLLQRSPIECCASCMISTTLSIYLFCFSCTVHFFNVGNKTPTNASVVIQYNSFYLFSLLNVSAFKLPSSGSLLRAFWDISPVDVEIYPMDGYVCYVWCRDIQRINYWVELPTTEDISQKARNKLPEDGNLNAKTFRSKKKTERIILNDNWCICWCLSTPTIYIYSEYVDCGQD
jgi:hypothetical protein